MEGGVLTEMELYDFHVRKISEDVWLTFQHLQEGTMKKSLATMSILDSCRNARQKVNLIFSKISKNTEFISRAIIISNIKKEEVDIHAASSV
ncbi:MAG: hypothetical protein ACI33P_16110 [Lysinibacillus sp.]